MCIGDANYADWRLVGWWCEGCAAEAGEDVVDDGDYVG